MMLYRWIYWLSPFSPLFPLKKSQKKILERTVHRKIVAVSGVRLNLLQWLTRSRLGSKNNSLREWVDSRVQHIWRLQVIGSWANTVIIFNKIILNHPEGTPSIIVSTEMIIKESEDCTIKHVFSKTGEKNHYNTVTSPAKLHNFLLFYHRYKVFLSLINYHLQSSTDLKEG